MVDFILNSTDHTRVPVRVALPPSRASRSPAYAGAAHSPFPRVRAPRRHRPPGVALGPAQGHAVPRLVPRPRGEQAVLATLSHYRGRGLTVALL